jgi:hypothetical protein
MKKSTITDLPNDIKAAVPEWNQKPNVQKIIELAKTGQFHDFRSEFATPKMALVQMLDFTEEPKLLPIREAVIRGNYDENL